MPRKTHPTRRPPHRRKQRPEPERHLHVNGDALARALVDRGICSPLILDHYRASQPTGEPRGKGVRALPPSPPGGSTGRLLSPPEGGTPSRAREAGAVRRG